MKTLNPVLLATFTAFAAGSVHAQASTGAQVRFEAETGPVTVTSVQPPIANAADYRVTVADLDRNGDGYLVRAEIPAGHALASEFRLVDTNRDGRITQAELSNWK